MGIVYSGVLVSTPIACPVSDNSDNCFDVDYYQSLLANSTTAAPLQSTTESLLSHTEL